MAKLCSSALEAQTLREKKNCVDPNVNCEVHSDKIWESLDLDHLVNSQKNLNLQYVHCFRLIDNERFLTASRQSKAVLEFQG